MVEDTEVCSIGSGDCENITDKRLLLTSKNSNRAISYLTPQGRLAFTQIRKAFIKALILRLFDSECYIWNETDASGYAITRVLSQLTLDNLG